MSLNPSIPQQYLKGVSKPQPSGKSCPLPVVVNKVLLEQAMLAATERLLILEHVDEALGCRLDTLIQVTATRFSFRKSRALTPRNWKQTLFCECMCFGLQLIFTKARCVISYFDVGLKTHTHASSSLPVSASVKASSPALVGTGTILT